MNLSPNILAKYFVDERALIRTTLITSCPRKTLTPFCLQKKRPENELSPPKQQCIGYLMTYDAIYPLFVLIVKLQFFQEKVLRVYYILNFGLLQSFSHGQYCSILPNFAFQH